MGVGGLGKASKEEKELQSQGAEAAVAPGVCRSHLTQRLLAAHSPGSSQNLLATYL